MGILNTNHSVICKYEKDDVKPSIDVVKKFAKVLNTTVAFLLGEAVSNDMFKESVQRIRYAQTHYLDAVLRDVKTRQAYAE